MKQLFSFFLFLFYCHVYGVYHYDAAGRLEHVIQQNGVIISYSYDEEGNIEAVATYKDTDADGLPDAWEIQYFGDATSGVPSNNEDNDDFQNWQEFAFGKLPNTKDTPQLMPTGIHTAGTDKFLTLSYTRSQSAVQMGYSYTIEVSTDLTTWNSGASYTDVLSTTANGDGTETLTIRCLSSLSTEPRIFMRLKTVTP